MSYRGFTTPAWYDLAEEPEYDERTDEERAADAEHNEISDEIEAADRYDRRHD